MRRLVLRARVLLAVVTWGARALAHAEPATEPTAERGLATPPRAAPRFVPTLGLEIGAFSESLRLSLAGAQHEETRRDLFLAPELGLWHPLGKPLGPALRVDGHASVAAGASFHSGDGRLRMREDVALVYQPLSWLSVQAGMGLGFALNTAHAARSQAELGLGLSVTLFRVVELVYLPYFSFPLGHDEQAVFGGQRELAASTAFVPVDFVLRGHFRRLSW